MNIATLSVSDWWSGHTMLGDIVIVKILWRWKPNKILSINGALIWLCFCLSDLHWTGIMVDSQLLTLQSIKIGSISDKSDSYSYTL